jgi:hypothetical protein
LCFFYYKNALVIAKNVEFICTIAKNVVILQPDLLCGAVSRQKNRERKQNNNNLLTNKKSK